MKGFILITTFIMVFILTTMVLSIISYNSMGVHIAANSVDEEIAFHTAEGAMNQATNNLLSGVYTNASFVDNTGGLYVFNASTPSLVNTINWSSPSAVIMSYQGSSTTQSAYFIEALPPGIQSGQSMKTPTFAYRITARAVGPSGGTVVILQSTVQVQQ